jgi:hypothetical protein
MTQELRLIVLKKIAKKWLAGKEFDQIETHKLDIFCRTQYIESVLFHHQYCKNR